MADALAQGDRIELRGFGSFGVKALPARQRRNPRTGTPVWLAAQRRPFFKAAKGDARPPQWGQGEDHGATGTLLATGTS